MCIYICAKKGVKKFKYLQIIFLLLDIFILKLNGLEAIVLLFLFVLQCNDHENAKQRLFLSSKLEMQICLLGRDKPILTSAKDELTRFLQLSKVHHTCQTHLSNHWKYVLSGRLNQLTHFCLPLTMTNVREIMPQGKT
jgi:hypothetical protein